MGAVAADLADRIVLTDDNPRSEDPAAIVAEIRDGMGDHPRVNVDPRPPRGAQHRHRARAPRRRRARSRAKVTKPSSSSAASGGAFSDRAVVAEILGVAP